MIILPDNPIIDLSNLSFYDQEKEYRSIRQRGERHLGKAVKVDIKANVNIRIHVERDLWQLEKTGTYVCLAG